MQIPDDEQQRYLAGAAPQAAPPNPGPASYRAPYPQVVIAIAPKNVGLAIALSFLFGPLGLLYASVTGAIVMFFVNVAAIFLTFGFGLFFTWPACVVWAVIATNNHNQALTRGQYPNQGA